MKQDLRKTSIFVQAKARHTASSRVDLGVNEQRSTGMDKKTKFFVSPVKFTPVKGIPIILCLLLLSFSLKVFAENMQIEVIQLYHRPAAEVIPVIKPLLEPGGSASGVGYNLIVKTTPQNMSSIKQIVEELDKPPVRLLISVRQGSTSQTQSELRVPSGGIKAFAEESRRQSTGVQTISVLDGAQAFIQMGEEVPVVTGQKTYYEKSISVEYKKVASGFYVTPKLIGNEREVQVAIDTQQQHRQRNGSIQTQSLHTTVTLPLGKWINLGKMAQDTASQQDVILFGTEKQGGFLSNVMMKVDIEE